MAFEYDIVAQNSGSQPQSITILNNSNVAAQVGSIYTFVLPYTATYSTNQFFILVVGSVSYYIYLTSSSTRENIVTLLNNLGFGDWKIDSTVSSNTYVGFSANPIVSLEVDTLTTPVSAIANSISNVSFVANWSAATGADGYYLDVATDSGFLNYVSGYQNLSVGNVTSYTISGLTVGITYYYRVRSFHGVIIGYDSNAISVLTDTYLTIGTGFDIQVQAISIQSDGKIIVGGVFTSYNGNSRNRIIRLNTDGTLDTSFSIGTGFNSTGIYSLAIQSDSKIIVGGQFTSYNGNSRNRIVRLNTDGTLDTSFSIGTGFNNLILSLAIQSDSKIIVGGQFTSYNGNSRNRIVRLNTDGTLDTSFSIGTGFSSISDIPISLAIQSDGKILVGGQFTSYNGNSRNRIVRLNTDGTIDTSFSIGTGFDSLVEALAIQSDGKILVGGVFTSYNGNTRNRIVRLNTDGTIDTSFSIGTGFDGTIYSLAIQSDGKILAGGDFGIYNGNNYNFIARLNTDGTLDTSFSIGTGFDNLILSLAIQSDGKILVGGDFDSYDGTTYEKLMRLYPSGLSNTYN